MKRQIKEILTHECQTYTLSKCVEYGDCIKAIHRLCDIQTEELTIIEDFAKWRDRLFTLFYNQINFAQILRNSDNEVVIYPMIYKILKGEV